MYSYDRRKTARRSVGDEIEGVQDAIIAAKEVLTVAPRFTQAATPLFTLLRVQPDIFDEVKALQAAATRVVNELPGVLNTIDAIDDAIDGYARHTRRSMPKDRKELKIQDLDKAFVRDLKMRALPALRAYRSIKKDVDDAPSAMELEDFYDSPLIADLNELASRMNELSFEMAFDADVEGLLELPENLLLERLNAT